MNEVLCTVKITYLGRALACANVPVNCTRQTNVSLLTEGKLRPSSSYDGRLEPHAASRAGASVGRFLAGWADQYFLCSPLNVLSLCLPPLPTNAQHNQYVGRGWIWTCGVYQICCCEGRGFFARAVTASPMTYTCLRWQAPTPPPHPPQPGCIPSPSFLPLHA